MSLDFTPFPKKGFSDSNAQKGDSGRVSLQTTRMKNLSRRKFLVASGAAFGLPTALSAQKYPSQNLNAAHYANIVGSNERVAIGIIGTANRAASNIHGVRNQDLVAFCDVDEQYLAGQTQAHPDAKSHVDFRKLIAEPSLDAVVVSTADHTHAPATIRALEAGLHVYCEKPLTHTVEEARRVATLAHKKKAVTQMGTQIHASDNYRRVVEIVRSGVLGEIREAHAWVGKAWGGGQRPTATEKAPSHFHHDLWLGPAPHRPYHHYYHPAQWRRFWDFGGGTLGDMGCHLIDLAFWALDLRHPTKVWAEGPKPNKETAPEQMRAHWEFPARPGHGDIQWDSLQLTWHDGGFKPSQFEDPDSPVKNFGSGVLFVGNKASLVCHYGNYVLFPTKDFADYVPPEPSITPSQGHYKEWLNAIRGEGETTCNFDYSGALTETVLLGNIAYRAGKPFKWNGTSLKASSSRAQKFVAKEVRPGWFD